VIQHRTADTRPEGDLAVLRDVALAGGRRWDREKAIPKSRIEVLIGWNISSFQLLSQGAFSSSL
jgi:hypothetical protein